MENKNKAKIMGYVVTTFLIAFISQLDQIDFAFSSLNASKWAGMLLKSAMPCLISLKALFDTSEVASTDENLGELISETKTTIVGDKHTTVETEETFRN
jgi:hypothetical protein